MNVFTPVNSGDKEKISRFLNRSPYLHLYAIGDLDERFSPFTEFFGIQDGNGNDGTGYLKEVACVYKGGTPPTVMALSGDFHPKKDSSAMRKLLSFLIPKLPETIEAHLSPGLEDCFSDEYIISSVKPYYKMALTDPDKSKAADMSCIERLGDQDISDMLELYESGYPGNWFEPDMLDLNCYFGIREPGEKRLICIAGTHVYSPDRRAAALGNIVTRQEFRGRGYGERVTAGICRDFVSAGMRVGLNVRQDNKAAISCYRKAGFTLHAEFSEYVFVRRNKTDK